MRVGLLALGAAACAVGCGDNLAVKPDAASAGTVDAAATPDAAYNPMTLFDTGLCVDHACTQISPDVHAYAPRWILWADYASKRRWYQLPPGAQIDTSDMDYWQFPVGTKFWKEFTSSDGSDGSGAPVRVETRFITRIGSAGDFTDWFYVAFEWNAANDDTVAVPTGVQNADGTMHDIPSRADCRSCHEQLQPSRILGFSALQLDAAAATTGDTDLASLVAGGTLTASPAGSGSPYFPFEATGGALDALGYLHANCGHCHNPTSQIQAITPLSLRLTVGTVAATATTPTYTTAVGVVTPSMVNGHSIIVDPGHPELSVMIDRFEADPATSTHMPALGSKVMDPTGDATLRAWITGL